MTHRENRKTLIGQGLEKVLGLFGWRPTGIPSTADHEQNCPTVGILSRREYVASHRQPEFMTVNDVWLDRDILAVTQRGECGKDGNGEKRQSNGHWEGLADAQEMSFKNTAVAPRQTHTQT